MNLHQSTCTTNTLYEIQLTFVLSDLTLKVYTEGFRVPVLNRRAIGCKSLKLYPIV